MRSRLAWLVAVGCLVALSPVIASADNPIVQHIYTRRPGGSVASGSALKQWNYDGSANLQWQLVDAGGGYHRIVNRTNGMVADSWGSTANGASVMQSAWNGGNNQQWRLDSLGDGRYQIINRGTGTALDGAGSSTAGATVVLRTPNNSTNNQWTITAI
jgi:hypothetical protein